MQSDTTVALRKALDRGRTLVGPDRLIDMSVRIYVVRQSLEAGVEVIPGMAPVEAIASHDIGGIWDCSLGCYVGYGDSPRVWYASEHAIDLILHASDMPRGLLAFGAMGSGKTRGCLAQWVVARALELAEYAPIEMGVTAPTDARLEEAVQAIRELMHPGWYQYNAHTKLFTLRSQVRIRCIGTARRSRSQGSRIQGWNWGAHAGDEIQDQADENANIDARGRRAPGGRYKRIATATAKDSSEWRALRQQLIASGQWLERRLEGRSNPFVHHQYWDDLKGSMSDREYRQIVLAEMLGPERATYPSFSREHNVRPRPLVGARDITQRVVGAHGLLGHDPGSSVDVTLLLRYYLVGRQIQGIWVCDEWTTRDCTRQEHILRVRRELRERHDLQWPEPEEPKVTVRIDPMGDSDTRTHSSVYADWRNAGFEARAAAYNKRGEGRGIIHKDAGIEMVNRLLCNALGQRRLFIDCDDRGNPVAPRLVEALEMSARDEHDKAETGRKGSREDLSHWAAALRYALWPYERLRTVERRREGDLLL